MELPWPVGAVLALLCYPVALLISGYLASQPSTIIQPLSSVPLKIWPLFSLMFGFASLISFIIGLKKKNLYKQNQSIQQIRNLSWRQFEFYVGQAYREKGYIVVETPEGPDGGVDLILRKDGEKTFVQCKHWKLHRVGVDKVREMLGSMVAGGADHGVLVTTGSFTKSAVNFGQQHGIKLIDGNGLENMIRVNPDQNDLIPEQIKDQIDCPICKSVMIKRVTKNGKYKGQQFWGCSTFPACKGKRSLTLEPLK